MKSSFCLFIGVCVAAMPIVCAQDLPPLQMKAAKLMRSGHLLSSAEMEVILGAQRGEILDLLRRVARSEVTEWADGSQLNHAIARRVLLQLPDPEVLEIIGNQLAEYQFISPYGTVVDGILDGVLRAKQPKLLPYFAKGVFRNEDAKTLDFEWSDPGKINRSMYSLSCMLRLTEVVEEFSPEVRAWARAMLKSHFLPENERRELGRAWWKDNESAILAGNYAAVRPGMSPAAGMPRTQPNVAPNPDDARRVGPPQKPGSQASGTDAASNPGTGDIAALPAARFSGWLPWAGAAIILAAAASWLFLRLRGKKN